MSDEKPEPKRAGVFSRGPNASELFAALRASGTLKLKVVRTATGAEPYCVMSDHGHVEAIPVPSTRFFAAIDDFATARKLPLPSRKTLVQLSEIVQSVVGAESFRDEAPLGASGGDWGSRVLSQELGGTAEPGGAAPAPVGETASVDLAALIPKTSDYIPRKVIDDVTDLQVLQRAFAAKPPHAVLIEGPPGSGKTACTRALAASLKLPWGRVSLSEAAETDDLLGRWTRRGSSWVWVDGLLPLLMREGGVLCLDELGDARPATLVRLHPVLDSRTLVLVEHLGETIQAVERFIAIATSNRRGEGAQTLDPRIRTRFTVNLVYESYDTKVEARLVPDPQLRRVWGDLRSDSRIHTDLSTRLLKQLAENWRVYGPRVAGALFLNVLDPEEREVAADHLVTLQRPRGE
jgi:Holliday junction resolvasome RuvABC ATP-dependent DNA helicase subunit